VKLLKGNKMAKELSYLNGQIDKLFPFLKKFREDLHKYPELSWNEFRTTQKIEEALASSEIKNFIKPLETGGYVDFVNQSGASFVLFRADIDALPITDLKDVPYASIYPGICHACGHDVHTTIILGLLLLMKNLKPDLSFNLRFVFQPAEEPIPGGASKLIPKGILNDVKHAIGIHVDPRIEEGVVSISPGWINMQSIRLNILLSAKGGHSAYPHKTADLVWIASRIVQDSFQIVYREFDILKNPIILTFTEINAGEGYNIIPSSLKLTGTLRVSDMETKTTFLKKLESLLEAFGSESKIRFNLEVSEGAPPVVNDQNLVEKFMNTHSNSLLKHIKIMKDLRSPGGDDFGYYSTKRPSVLIRFGIAKEGFDSALHTGNFDVDSNVIKIALRYLSYQLLNLEI
jgi:amidohydrolase